MNNKFPRRILFVSFAICRLRAIRQVGYRKETSGLKKWVMFYSKFSECLSYYTHLFTIIMYSFACGQCHSHCVYFLPVGMQHFLLICNQLQRIQMPFFVQFRNLWTITCVPLLISLSAVHRDVMITMTILVFFIQFRRHLKRRLGMFSPKLAEKRSPFLDACHISCRSTLYSSQFV